MSGAKNAVLPAMAAALLTRDEVVFTNVPDIADVGVMADILRELGAHVSFESPHCMVIRSDGLENGQVPGRLAGRLRASFVLMGALLGRLGSASSTEPGGDALGQRPVALHVQGFQALGATIKREGDQYRAAADQLHGATVVLDYPSVTGTENIMFAAVLAKGHTTIVNAATEPEIRFLGDFLNDMGAQVSNHGTHTIEIDGVAELHGAGATIIPDRLEAGTFAMAAAITNGDVTITNAHPRHLDALWFKMRDMGVQIDEGEAGIRVRRLTPELRCVDVQAVPYPGLATDLQSQVAVLLSVAHGACLVHERVFNERFQYVEQLKKLGPDIVMANATTAFIRGPAHLHGAEVRAVDIRAGAALVLAGLAAPGETVITDIYHLDRGYERLDEKLRGLGARIERITGQ